MSKTDRVWEHAEDAFKSANKAFEEADRIFSKLPKGVPHVKDDTIHQLHFNAPSLGERWRLACKFFMMGWAMLLKGKAQLRFRNR